MAEHLGQDVVALAAYSNVELLMEQILRFQPKIACIYLEAHYQQLKTKFPDIRIVTGMEGLLEVASYEEADFVVMAIVGLSALKPTLAAIEAGKTIGLASKEVLVSAGELVMALCAKKGVKLLPIDSEHSAIFQCLDQKPAREVRRIILTASGGPFRDWSAEQLEKITVTQALAHPKWKMGPKITIDSSTLMNKGLEMIEARWLFDLSPEKIDVVIHPQSLVHSFVEFIDGSLLAQISEPDMVFPIQYALTYPERIEGLFKPFDFCANQQWHFYQPDQTKFLALTLAYEAMQMGKSAPTFLNGANEVLVDRFLKKEISWLSISQILEKLLDRHQKIQLDSLETILNVDREARQEAQLA